MIDDSDQQSKDISSERKPTSLETKYQSTKNRSSTQSRLCQSKVYEECPSSAITDTVYTAGVTGLDFWTINETQFNGSKEFSAGRVELQIRDRFDLTDFAEIAYQTKEVIATQFGEQTLKLHYALAAIAFRHPEAWRQEIKVSVSKLLEDFGEDQKRNHYIPEAERNSNNSPTRYYSKEEKLRYIVHHLNLLKRLEVWVKEWRTRSKKIFTVEKTHLWDVFTITEVIQKDLFGGGTLLDIEITFRPGLWFEKFAGTEYLREFGYITGEALKLDPNREKMALRIAYFALFALQQHKSGRYKIETLLNRIGYEKDIEAAKTDGKIAWNLKRSFDRALKTLFDFEHPYKFEYDVDAPEWVALDNEIRKPHGWFELWLKLSGTLQQPEILPKRSGAENSPQAPVETNITQDASTETTQAPKNTTVAPELSVSKAKTKKQTKDKVELPQQVSFGEKIRKARIAQGVSLRAMALHLNISPARLSQIENGRYPHPVQPSLEEQILAYLDLKK